MKSTLVPALLTLLTVSSCLQSSASAQDASQLPKVDPALEKPIGTIKEFLPRPTLSQAVAQQKTLVEAKPDDAEQHFRLGMMQFLRALEGLGQDHHRFGLMSGQRMTIPLMRLPVPENKDPEKLTYEKARGIIKSFLKRLTAARETLAAIDTEKADIKVPVDLASLRLDLNSDDEFSESESLFYISSFVQRGGRTPTKGLPESFPVTFDNADVSWLEGYCHVLSAFCEVALAYDWKQQFDTSAILFYPNAETPFEFLKNEPQRPVTAFGRSSIFDIVAFLHNINHECTEPKRMLSALQHLESVVACNRKTWALIKKETDDDREWLPSPEQTSIMGDFAMTQQIVSGWNDVMDEFDAILKGKKLAPFWRGIDAGTFNGPTRWNKKVGINVRRIFTEPTRFDLALWLHGSGLNQYLEEGDISSPEYWRKFNRAFGNRFWNFALWIN